MEGFMHFLQNHSLRFDSSWHKSVQKMVHHAALISVFVVDHTLRSTCPASAGQGKGPAGANRRGLSERWSLRSAPVVELEYTPACQVGALRGIVGSNPTWGTGIIVLAVFSYPVTVPRG